ncbi:MAG: S9 family peptidase [Saprospiraceae bacterium]|nr:S9 family peptidase [Saprospiraceae bacterium]
MRTLKILCPLFIVVSNAYLNAQQMFPLEAIMTYPFPDELVAAKTKSRIAFSINEQGRRNIYVSESPEFGLRKLTSYDNDSGQEISQVSISADGEWIVYVRGGDFGSNWDDEKVVNPAHDPVPEKLAIWSVPFEGGDPIKIDEGVAPAIHPNGRELAYLKNGQIYLASIDGSVKPRAIVEAKGRQLDLQWSNNGQMLAFVSYRNDHSFTGIYRDSLQAIQWIDPSFDYDFSPRWSPDDSAITFVRHNGSGGAPDSILASIPQPYSILVSDIGSGDTRQIWKSPHTMRGSLPTTHGGVNLHWGKNHIVFLSYQDGWPHLYSISPDGQGLKCLTPGNFMTEYISMNPDGTKILAAANTGADLLDIDRRHIILIDLERQNFEVLTPGPGNEWAPRMMADNGTIAYISAGPKQPPLITVSDRSGPPLIVTRSLIPNEFPEEDLVTPRQVIFPSADGIPVHATLFNVESPNPKPAIIYIHGGPPRQMLLGWHYSSYYSNAYALNQYLASQGFAVLSVNYRLGIGYGYDFHRPPDGGVRGASEYQDIKAAGEWLKSQEFIQPDHIGVYGGSYGGYLTAMALGRDSELFAAGVDIHGVHDRTINRTSGYLYPDRYEQAPDVELFREVAWKSSPVSSVDSWTSPVLIIHADDDRNVAFSQSTDLVQRLRRQEVEMETLVIVDDTHHFMLFENQKKVNMAAAEFLIRKLKR